MSFKLGAEIVIEEDIAKIQGRPLLKGCEVNAWDSARRRRAGGGRPDGRGNYDHPKL